jgi:molecular chaperone GrpE
MRSNTNGQEEIEDQDIEMTDGFGGDGAGNPAHNSADTDATDRVADAADGMSCDGGNENEDDDNDDEPTPRITPEEEAALWKDKFVRLSAEYDNYRKRTFKEKMEIIAAGGEDVVRAMLDVLDDMDRALEAMAKTDDLAAVRQGITLIDSKLKNALKSRGLAEIEAVGRELDTDLHEAVARIATEEKEMKGRIIDVVQKGYKLKDKIIRYAKVVVGQ